MQIIVSWEKGTVIEELFTSDWPDGHVCQAVSWLMIGWTAQSAAGSATYGEVVLGSIRKLTEAGTKKRASKEHSFMVSTWSPLQFPPSDSFLSFSPIFPDFRL